MSAKRIDGCIKKSQPLQDAGNALCVQLGYPRLRRVRRWRRLSPDNRRDHEGMSTIAPSALGVRNRSSARKAGCRTRD